MPLYTQKEKELIIANEALTEKVYNLEKELNDSVGWNNRQNLKDKIALTERVKELKVLLKIAKCPNCDGSGAIPVPIVVSGSRQISETEFEQTQEVKWEPEQCQWCDEKTKLLAPTERGEK